MIKVGKRHLLACVALSILMVAVTTTSHAALFGLLKSKGKAEPVRVKQSLVVFPFDRDSEVAGGLPEDFGTNVGEYLRSTLTTSPNYSVFLYQERLAPIRRAKEDNTMKDIAGPFFTDKVKSGKLAELLAADLYLIGSVESYNYDRDRKVADLTLKADLVRVKTGKVVQEFMVGGQATSGAQAMEEEELRSIAAGKAVDALKEKIAAAAAADQPAPKPKATKEPKQKAAPKTAPKTEPKAEPAKDQAPASTAPAK